MGEHAVVHGKPTLLSAINKRLYVQVSACKKGVVIETSEEKRLVEKAVEVVCKRFKIENPVIHIQITSTIPSGRHAGSSAAVSVATVGALLYYLKKIWNPDLTNSLAYEVEKFQHKTPSGGDNSICTYGGFVWFRKELEFLKTIWQIPLTLPESFSPFYLVDTGKPEENTGDMVSLVHDFVKANPKKARELFSANEHATKDITMAIKTGDELLLVDSIRRGEKTLEHMGVVSSNVQPFIRRIEQLGGAAKILGGGGKKGAVGFLLAYLKDAKKLQSLSAKQGFSCELVVLGAEGVRLEKGKI